MIVDNLYPDKWGGVTNPALALTREDSCLTTTGIDLGRPQDAALTRLLYYTIASPCILDYSRQKALQQVACSKDPECSKGYIQFVEGYWPEPTLTPIGLAFDGRVIYGPFDANGRLWQPCDVDVCNGLYLNNEYVYVATMFHPYTVGCWGPGDSLHIAQSCSANPRKCFLAATFI
jgi:hypothetical protein